MPRMAHCGALRIGVESSEPKIPPLVIVKTPPSRSASVILPSRAFCARAASCFSISANPSAVAIAEDRDHETALGGNGHADVVEMVFDQRVAVELGVDGRHLLERAHNGFDEERHEAEFHAVLPDKFLLVSGAEIAHRRHVDLVKGGEHRGLVLGLDEPLRKALAKRGEFPAGRAILGTDTGDRTGSSVTEGRGFCGPGTGDAVGSLETSPVSGICFPVSGVRFPGSAAASRSPLVTRPPLPVPATVEGSTPVSAATRRTAGDGGGGCGGCRCRRRVSALPPDALGVDGGDQLADLDLAAGGDLECDAAGGLGGAFGSDLVGLQFEERLVFLHKSPSLTCHLASTPPVIDSPMDGILTSRIGMGRKVGRLAYVSANCRSELARDSRMGIACKQAPTPIAKRHSCPRAKAGFIE